MRIPLGLRSTLRFMSRWQNYRHGMRLPAYTRGYAGIVLIEDAVVNSRESLF